MSASWRRASSRVFRSLAVRIATSFPNASGALFPPGARRKRVYLRLTESSRRPRPPLGLARVPDASSIKFDRAEHPVVSVVIPVHGKTDLTLRCLSTLADSRLTVPIEVIVVDDASPAGTAERLKRIEGLRLIGLDDNRGFLGATNAGISAARGDFVLLLNNDTQVAPLAVEAMVRLAQADTSIGAVGARLLFPDGRLQEAGGIVFSDGTGWNYGRFEEAHASRFLHVRDVDYCSGACLLARRSDLDRLGGLDSRFSPAYYEDTDLAFALRDLGKRVVYQPDAIVFHVEGASHGTSEESGIKRYQTLNRTKFVDKWAEALQRQMQPGTEPAIARDRRRGPRVLVIDGGIPTPDRDSGSVRRWAMLSLLHELGAVVTFAPDNDDPIGPYTHDLHQSGIEVIYGEGALEGYLASVGPSLEFAVLARPDVAAVHFANVRTAAPNAQLIYDTVDLYFLRASRWAALSDSEEAARQAERWRKQEAELIGAADVTLAITTDEQRVIEQLVPGARVEVIPNIHEIPPESGSGFDDRSGLLFVGNFVHPPNVDGIVWFIEEVLPLVRDRLPDVRLELAGHEPPVLPPADGVTVHGWVPDLRPFYERARVFIAPLRYGAGMKGKVGESMAYGIPVVTTAIGAEGLGARDGQHLSVADDPASFAANVVDLYTDAARWRGMSHSGRSFIADHYSREAARTRLAKLVGLPDRAS